MNKNVMINILEISVFKIDSFDATLIKFKNNKNSKKFLKINVRLEYLNF